MRVIAGRVRGLKLVSPNGEKTRPTLDRVKEAVFSMLLPYINGSVVLDLFAGSGALGIESLSRGAGKAFFVDSSKEAIKAINQNLTSSKFSEDSEVLKSDAIEFLNNCNQEFDIIFIDPPYRGELYDSVINSISRNTTLSKNGLIIVESDIEAHPFENHNENFVVFKEKKYGRVGITVLKWR